LLLIVSATYVFCAVQAARKPRLGQPPPGPPGLGKPRLLDGGDGLWLVVADAPPSRYGEDAVRRGLHDLKWLSRCAVGHEAVVEHWLRAGALVPMKLFTIFENDFRAVTEVGRRRRDIDRSLARLAGRREWGVRIRAVSGAGSARIRGARSTTHVSGTSYLAAKRQRHQAAREQLARSRSQMNDAFNALAAVSDDAQRHPPPAAGAETTRLALDAAFLVSNRTAARFRIVVRRLARQLRSAGYGVELTGPWPPYNFVDA
jgi:hypothetical protein